MMKFRIEQIALAPQHPLLARKLLEDLGLTEWIKDTVESSGEVFGKPSVNKAKLQFNYEASPRHNEPPLELEILHYVDGRNWIDDNENIFRGNGCVSHLGMHVEPAELLEFRNYFEENGIKVAQDVETLSHTNPAIAGKRRYRYVVFSTHEYIGVDLKFIVRLDG